MISREQALALARSWAAAGADPAPEVDLYEFDLGYVAWPVTPAQTGRAGPPPATGTPQVVVDRATGALSQWPSLPAATPV